MISNELGRQLHDRATRGEKLSDEEQAQLNGWYEAQDKAESDLLSASKSLSTTVELQKPINSILVQLADATKRIQEMTEENEALRQEIAELRRQLAERTSPQLA